MRGEEDRGDSLQSWPGQREKSETSLHVRQGKDWALHCAEEKGRGSACGGAQSSGGKEEGDMDGEEKPKSGPLECKTSEVGLSRE